VITVDLVRVHFPFMACIYTKAWMGNLFVITGRMNCVVYLAGRKIIEFYLKILP